MSTRHSGMGHVPVGLVLLGLASIGHAAPPRVVRASPDNADLGVDSATTLLRIEFDQEMNAAGRSICGGGPTFPKITGDVTWADARTILVPIALEPGKAYSMSINCPAARNFASKAGESAEPYPITFTTRREGEAAPVLTSEQAAAGEAALRKAIDERYSYRGLREKNWDRVFDAGGASLREARTPSEFGRAAAKLLGVARDLHVTVRVGEMTLGTHRANAPGNVDLKLLSGVVKDWTRPSQRVATGTVEGIPYLLLGDWSGTAKEYEPAFQFIRQHHDAPAMIVDVRTNFGGDELIARSVAALFVDKPTVYSKNKTRDPEAPGGWTRVLDRVVEPVPGSERFGGRVAVLIGKQCMSSNESFVLMLKHGAANRAVLIGETTYGSSGNPRPVEVCPNVRVLLPTWVEMTPDGETLEGKGIAPDVAVAWKPSHGNDPILQAAAERLKKN